MKKLSSIILTSLCAGTFAYAVVAESNAIGMNASMEANATDMNATDANVTAAASAVDLAKGETLYKKCIACHGAKADVAYLNGKVPALNATPAEVRLERMQALKAGIVEGGKGYYGMGAVMKGQMAPLSSEDMASVNAYIDTLK